MRCFRRGLQYAPRDARLHENLGTALEALGDADEAVRSYREALRLDPGAADAQAALGVCRASADRRTVRRGAGG